MTNKNYFTMICAAAILALGMTATIASAQDAQAKRFTFATDKPGMVWFWVEGTRNADLSWNLAAEARTAAFAELAAKIKDGDPAKVRLYMYKAGKTQSEAESAWAVGSDYSRNLAESPRRH